MFDTKILIVIGISVSLLVGAWIFSLKQDISILEKEKAIIQLDFNSCLSNSQTLKGAIDTQNKKIEQYEISLVQKQNELEKWKEQPPQVKYKTIEKIITKENSNECKDIKNMLDDIRTTSF
jgi:uncharacterized membrane protein YgaE (UPF0421/DUF939 family)